jgi:hypothetical protein
MDEASLLGALMGAAIALLVWFMIEEFIGE